MKVKYLIIGSGPTGLGAALRLKELGESDFLIVDQNPWIGGLSASFVDQKGFTWDIGGHVQFSHYKYFDQVMDDSLGIEGWLQHQRESWVWMKDRFIPYPFQNNIRYLPKEEVWRCIKGAMDISLNPSKSKPNNFKEWILTIFGEGIAELFMNPYNFKVWAYPTSEMDYQWIGERVSVVDLKRVTENVILEKDDLSWGPNNLFRFPKFGGTGAIWNSVAKMIGLEKILLKSQVNRILPDKKIVEIKDGQKVEYQTLLSTMPLDCLLRAVEGVSSTEISKLQQMKYSSSNIVGVGLHGKPKKELEPKCWMYFPEQNCPFYRVTLFSKYSPNNVPDISKYFSLMTETSESGVKPVDHARLIEDTIQGLINTKLIESKDQVYSTWSYRANYGYPTPFIGRDKLLRELLPLLEEKGIFSRGRFGAWRYEVSNQDHSFMQGVEWVDRQIKGAVETTLWGTH